MKDAYEVLHQKEADLARVRHEIEGVQVVASLLSNELPLKDASEILQQKEVDLARVRHEIESLQIVASLLSDELPSDELTKKCASSAEEPLDRGHSSEATGTDGLFSSVIATPRPRFWKLLKRKT